MALFDVARELARSDEAPVLNNREPITISYRANGGEMGQVEWSPGTRL